MSSATVLSQADKLKAELAKLNEKVSKLSDQLGIELPKEKVKIDGSLYNEKIPKEILRKMLIKENELRLSKEVQAIYADYNQHPEKGDWINYTHQLQADLIRSFGYGTKSDDELQWCLHQLRTATTVYPDLAEIPLYVRYNRAKRGNLRQGDLAPDIRLHEYQGNCRETSLLEMKQIGRPLVVCAASWT